MMQRPPARRPNGGDWKSSGEVDLGRARADVWQSGPIVVFSSVTDEPVAVPVNGAVLSVCAVHWLISVSTTKGKAPKPHHLRKALRAFGMTSARQDPHQEGRARHFWLPVDPTVRPAS